MGERPTVEDALNTAIKTLRSSLFRERYAHPTAEPAAAVLTDLRGALATAEVRSVMQGNDARRCFIQLHGSPALAALLAGEGERE
jgi:hypothetical protein